MKQYDVIIIGSGPAGIFAALEFLKSEKAIKVLMIEKGRDITQRRCPSKERQISCTSCPECDLLSGWGGAGAFSDGKLSLSPEVGGFLSRYMDNDCVQSMIDYVDSIYIQYGAPDEIFGDHPEEIQSIERLASKNNLELIPSKIRHIGTDRCLILLKKMKDEISRTIEIIFKAEAEQVLIEDGTYKGITLKDKRTFFSTFLIHTITKEEKNYFASQDISITAQS